MEATISNYMTEQPYSVRPSETLEHAQKMMADHRIRHLPVLESGKVVGLISERDFSLVHLYPDLDLKHSTVEDLMMQDVFQVSTGALLKDVVKGLSDKKIGSCIVVDDQQNLKGIFTSIDALNLMHKIYDI